MYVNTNLSELSKHPLTTSVLQTLHPRGPHAAIETTSRDLETAGRSALHVI